jgi:hypothetical protein
MDAEASDISFVWNRFWELKAILEIVIQTLVFSVELTFGALTAQ